MDAKQAIEFLRRYKQGSGLNGILSADAWAIADLIELLDAQAQLGATAENVFVYATSRGGCYGDENSADCTRIKKEIKGCPWQSLVSAEEGRGVMVCKCGCILFRDEQMCPDCLRDNPAYEGDENND